FDRRMRSLSERASAFEGRQEVHLARRRDLAGRGRLEARRRRNPRPEARRDRSAGCTRPTERVSCGRSLYIDNRVNINTVLMITWEWRSPKHFGIMRRARGATGSPTGVVP